MRLRPRFYCVTVSAVLVLASAFGAGWKWGIPTH